jgi:hypothetical protein
LIAKAFGREATKNFYNFSANLCVLCASLKTFYNYTKFPDAPDPLIKKHDIADL